METKENQLELFESSEEKMDSKEELAKFNARIAKAKAEKLETDNALRKGTLVYANKAEESFQRMLNIVYGSLQVLLSEDLPFELVNCQTSGEIRERLVGTYNDVIKRGQEAFEDYLKNSSVQKIEEETEGNDDEPAS